MKNERWPATIVTHQHKGRAWNSKIDFHPETGKPHGFYIYRGDRSKDEEIDDILDEISRKASRAMQGRWP